MLSGAVGATAVGKASVLKRGSGDLLAARVESAANVI
jgi:hypothetical protein